MHKQIPFAALLCSVLGVATAALGQSVSITVDPTGPGPTFDGLGAVSAGASSRLLYDYPEPYRSQVLDYLFLPHYGASLQHLKVEVGSDVNSTDGSEPSHMRTPQDKDFTRGYEWWLMQEAHRRNPKIILDSLAWGSPGWVGKNTLYTPAMAHYSAVFLNGAESQYHLNIPYTGIWNEWPFDAQYVKTLRQVLDKERPAAKIVCCDEYFGEAGGGQWSILEAMRKDPALARAVDVVTVHYPREKGKLTTPADATSAGKPLWSSEDQPESSAEIILSRDWAIGGRSLAHLYNENYLQGHFTKTEIWSPVTSYYDILAAPNSGLMYANTPWSGHYQVQGAIWATAHTTQFAEPGWRYLQSASGQLSPGSYVTLAAPDGHDWSMVVETIDSKQPTSMTVAIKGSLGAPPSHGTLHVWETNQKRTFERVGDITPHNGSFTYTFDPDSLYTITTTTGQHKGTAVPPPSKPFPLPYHESFEKTPLLRAPAYLSDQDGAYEVHPCTGRSGRCLEQVITQKPVPWGPLPDPWTLAGDIHWNDYRERTDFQLPDDGVATLIGRIDSADVFAGGKARYPSGYVLRVQADGHWALLAIAYKKDEKRLAEGEVPIDGTRWHSMELSFHGSTIHASIDQKAIADLQDQTHAHGMIGVGSGWEHTSFDNLSVDRVE
jgi:hypothetical protein